VEQEREERKEIEGRVEETKQKVEK